MRALLSIVAGGPGRVSVSAAFVATIFFVLAGDGWDLLRATWFAFLWIGAFVLTWAILALFSAALGLDALPEGPAPKETDRA